jgi:hypothetical protein
MSLVRVEVGRNINNVMEGDWSKKIIDGGCWMLDIGYWILDIGCLMLDTGYLILVT